MTEQEIITELLELREEFKSVEKLPGAKTVYLASPWFDDQQARLLLNSYYALLQNPTIGHIHVPLLNQYKGQVLSLGNSTLSPDEKYEWAVNTYSADINAIRNSDLTIALETPTNVDTGTSFEMGATIGMNKPLIALFNEDINKVAVNLMESFGVTYYTTEVDELVTIDVRSIPTKRFDGMII